MVDELVMPDPKYHTKWARELQQMRSHMVGQPASPLLWISIAGIYNGQPEHFKHNYLAPLMPGFHMPVSCQLPSPPSSLSAGLISGLPVFGPTPKPPAKPPPA